MESVDEVGSLEAGVDSRGEIACVTQVVDVQVVRLGDVTLGHTIAEGADHNDVAAWRASHKEFWRPPEYDADMGELPPDDTLVACFRFAIDPRHPVRI